MELLGWRDSSSSVVNSMQATKFNSGTNAAWEYFPCPFCNVEVEFPVLSSHLQEEHCFDAKNAVCPVCAANLGKDLTGHFTMQHSHLLKRRKPQRNSLWNSSQVQVEREPHELWSFLGTSSTNRRTNTSDAAPDPLLLSFISYPDSIDDKEANSDPAARDASSLRDQSLKPSKSSELLEHDLKEMSQRADFFQQMLLSTIF